MLSASVCKGVMRLEMWSAAILTGKGRMAWHLELV